MIAAFSLLGILLGVATLIVVMSVMNGFRAELLNQILGLNGHIGLYGKVADSLENFDDLTREVGAIDGVAHVAPIVNGQAMVARAGTANGAVVRGLRLEDARAKSLLSDNIVFGSLDDFRGEDVVMIGTAMSFQLGANVGDRINLITPKGRATVFGSVPRVRAFTVVGIFEVGMSQYDAGFIFMPLKGAQTYFRTGEAVSNLEVTLTAPDAIDAVKDALAPIERRIAGRLVDWEQANDHLVNALRVERNVMFLILTLIILVAAFNIVSGMVMLVKDKGRDIAILRTMGATRGMVMRIFLLSGASIGIAGTVLGLAAGVAFCENIDRIKGWIERLTDAELFASEIYFLSKLPARIDPNEVIAVCVMALTLTFLASLYPSWRAARMDPVEALRYE